MTVRRTDRPTKIPGIPKPPANVGPELRRYLESISEAMEIRLGRRGDPVDRAITLRELIQSGLARELRASPFDPNNIGGGNIGFVDDGQVDVTNTPPQPTGFTASGAYSVINLMWDFPLYTGPNHAHTEIYSYPTDSLGDAISVGVIGVEPGRGYIDPVGSGVTRYYWIRHVNEAGTPGPWNSASGTIASTSPDVDVILGVLNQAITESELATDLTSKLDGFEDDIADLETTFGNTASAATSAAAAAASESAAIAAKVAALLAQGNAETAEQNAETAETNAVTARSGAETAQTAASQSATGAAGSASSASQSAITSANSATAAGSSASAAATSETNAATYATNAGTASTASQTSRLAAEAAETNAGTSATAAATSATNASASQTAASQSASVANTNKIAAETARSGAETAETNAASSETNASGSASSASTSATNAANSATAAGNSASAANTSAQTASTQATNAGTSASAASASQTAASTSATNAANSAGAASTSATTAAASETAAGQSATTATTQANTATTKAGEASTFASNAATSESNAAGSASAASSTVNGLTARLDNAGGTGVTVEQQFSANATSLGTLEGQYTVKVDANGAVAGFGLANTTTSSGNNTSEFYVNADRFAIMRGGSDTTAAVTPFTVQATATTINGIAVPAGVYMDAAFIKAASITSAQIGSVNADTITTGELDVAGLITANAIDASKLNIDGSSITSVIVNGTPTLQLGSVNVNKLTGNSISATIMSGTTVYADNLTGDVAVLLPFRSTSTVSVRGNTASGGGTVQVTSQQLPATSHSTNGHKAFASVTGWYDSTANKTYAFRLYMQDTAGGSQSLGSPISVHNYSGTLVMIFSGDKSNLVSAGQTITASGKSHTTTSASYNTGSNATSIVYTLGSGSAFTTSDTISTSSSSGWQLVGQTRFKANTNLYAQFALSGSLSNKTLGAVNMKLEVTRTGTSGIGDNDTSTAVDYIHEVSGFIMGAR